MRASRQNADDRGIEGATMTGAEMRRIRNKVGLSIPELASLLRYRDFDGLRKIEEGVKPMSGPIQLAMEMLDDGRLDPNTELDEAPVCEHPPEAIYRIPGVGMKMRCGKCGTDTDLR